MRGVPNKTLERIFGTTEVTPEQWKEYKRAFEDAVYDPTKIWVVIETKLTKSKAGNDMKVISFKLKEPANEYETSFVARKYVVSAFEKNFLEREAQVDSWLDLKGKEYRLDLKEFYNTITVERMSDPNYRTVISRPVSIWDM